MGLFPRFDEQVPEPSENLPRKTGLARLWQLASRDLWGNFLAGLLALLGCVPFAGGLVLAVIASSMPLAPLCGLVGGAIAGPELCGLADTLLRGLRDDVGRAWWPTYRRAWRRNAKTALLPGALGGALLSAQIFTLLHAGALAIDLVTSVALVLGIVISDGADGAVLRPTAEKFGAAVYRAASPERGGPGLLDGVHPGLPAVLFRRPQPAARDQPVVARVARAVPGLSRPGGGLSDRREVPG